MSVIKFRLLLLQLLAKLICGLKGNEAKTNHPSMRGHKRFGQDFLPGAQRPIGRNVFLGSGFRG